MLENKENYISSFMEKHNSTINKMGQINYDRSPTASLAYKSLVKMALESAYIKYHSKNKTSNYLDSYLFGTLKIANLKLSNENKTSALICPGCKENNHIEVLSHTSDGLCCSYCLSEKNNSSLSKKDLLSHNIFAIHSSSGFRCPDCSRFIPDRIENILNCPYSSCNFIGNKVSMNKMNHPTVKINRSGNSSNIDYISSKTSTYESRLSAQEEMGITYRIINECIDEQIKTLEYKGHQSTKNIKLCTFMAFKSCLDKYPEDTIPYLSHTGKVGGTSRIQSKVFQELALLLESSLPFSYMQNNKENKIESILDERLNIFDGKSIFEAEVNDKLEIPNLTEEIYTGSRLGSYCLPFYIGKLIDVVLIEDGTSLMSDVLEYGCTKINMKIDSVTPGMKVKVTHLRIVPHYQMGAFTHIARLKKDIVDRVQIKLKNIK